MNDTEYMGNPKLYRKLAIGMAAYISISTYLVFSSIKYFLHGETWVFGWKPIAIAVVFALFFSRMAFRWIMRLDAQYGSGSSWTLESVQVKLPELRHHK